MKFDSLTILFPRPIVGVKHDVCPHFTTAQFFDRFGEPEEVGCAVGFARDFLILPENTR